MGASAIQQRPDRLIFGNAKKRRAPVKNDDINISDIRPNSGRSGLSSFIKVIGPS
jgi:hypothetical protein